MAGNGATLAQHSRLFVRDSGDTAWLAIKGLTSVGFPESTAEELECTDLESDAKEYFAALSDSGDFGFELNYDDTNTVHRELDALSLSKEARKFRIELATRANAGAVGSTCTASEFTGFIKGFALNGAETGGKLVRSGTVRVSGAHTIAYDDARQTF